MDLQLPSLSDSVVGWTVGADIYSGLYLEMIIAGVWECCFEQLCTFTAYEMRMSS